MPDTPQETASYILAIGRIDAVPMLLDVLCETTGMRFAAVARVTAESWTACAVRDELQMGILPGTQIDADRTLCCDVITSGQPIVIDHASTDPVYSSNPLPKLHGFESFVSVPIITRDAEYFGNLCALDPLPIKVSEARTKVMFERIAQLIGNQLELKKMHEQAHEALLKEQASGELREQFIAILGHDLRKPLLAIQAGIEQLENTTGDAASLAVASQLRTAAGRMSSVIGDVLDFARGRLGAGISVRLEAVENLDGLFESVVKDLCARQPLRKIICNSVVGCPVYCDAARLQQLAGNLLDNALAHGSPLGPVSFIAMVDHDCLVIQVWNAGEPIPPHSIPQIFEPFWRRTTSDQRDGVGLGLHICRQIVRAHRGQISVTSTKKNGTQFTARMPLSHPPG